MNRKLFTLGLVSLVIALMVGVGISSAQGPINARGPRNTQAGLMRHLPAPSATTLPDEIVQLVMAGWEDEKHAAAVYAAVIDQFGQVRPFTNILRSEEQHARAWETIMTRYNIPMPEYDAPAFEPFANLSEACAAAAEAEVANYALYETMFQAFAPYPDLLYVATALQTSSQNQHLPAFERCSSL